MIEKNNYILGLNISGQNTSACILKNGKLVAFAEEERFTRVKLATNSIPVNSAKFCLDYTKTNLNSLNAITLGWSYDYYPNKMLRFYSLRNSLICSSQIFSTFLFCFFLFQSIIF